MALFAKKLHTRIASLEAYLTDAQATYAADIAIEKIAHLEEKAEQKERYDGALAGRDAVIEGLRQALAAETKRATGLEGGLSALQEHVHATELRLQTIERGHHWRTGGAVEGHEGGKLIAYECVCNARVMAPEGFFERKL